MDGSQRYCLIPGASLRAAYALQLDAKYQLQRRVLSALAKVQAVDDSVAAGRGASVVAWSWATVTDAAAAVKAEYSEVVSELSPSGAHCAFDAGVDANTSVVSDVSTTLPIATPVA